MIYLIIFGCIKNMFMCYAAHSAVLLKAESAVDKVEWINKLRNIATLKNGQGMGEHGLSMRQSHSDGSLVSFLPLCFCSWVCEGG